MTPKEFFIPGQYYVGVGERHQVFQVINVCPAGPSWPYEEIISYSFYGYESVHAWQPPKDSWDSLDKEYIVISKDEILLYVMGQ